MTLKLGMVGGGQGAFIGGVHRMAARLDGRWELVAGALSSDPAKLSAPVKDAADKWALLPAFLAVRGLVKQHIESFNYFLNHDIRKIMATNGRVVCDVDPNFYLRCGARGLCVGGGEGV